MRDGALDLAALGDIAAKQAIALFNEAGRQAAFTIVELAGGKRYRRDNGSGAIAVDAAEKGLGVLSARAKLARSKGQEYARVEIFLDRLVVKDTETTPYSSNPDKNNALIAASCSAGSRSPGASTTRKLAVKSISTAPFPSEAPSGRAARSSRKSRRSNET